MKREILETLQSHSFVSCRISHRLFHEAGTLRNHLIFRQVQQSLSSPSRRVLCVQFIQQSRQEQFLAQMARKLHRSLFEAHLPLEVDWCHQEQMCLIVMKNSKLLKHLKCHIL